jgi:hypothetical protein
MLYPSCIDDKDMRTLLGAEYEHHRRRAEAVVGLHLRSPEEEEAYRTSLLEIDIR